MNSMPRKVVAEHSVRTNVPIAQTAVLDGPMSVAAVLLKSTQPHFQSTLGTEGEFV
jgi:hypothetical protein